MVHHHQPGDDAGILSRHHALEARISSHLCTLRPKRGKRILEHDFSENKLWLVKWLIDEPPGGTWENRETLNDVEAFQHYCTANTSNAFLPRSHPLWEASMPSTQRRTAAQLKVLEQAQDISIGTSMLPVYTDTGVYRGGRNTRHKRIKSNRNFLFLVFFGFSFRYLLGLFSNSFNLGGSVVW